MSIDLEPIKARLAKACPGPWVGGTLRDPLSGDCLMFMREDDPRVCGAVLFSRYTDNDTAVMLLHSRADMDALVAEVEYLRGERAAVVAFLRETLATSETAHASDDLDYAIDIIARGEHRREEE